MSVLQIICGIVLLILSVVIIFVVILQEGHEANVGVISGGADNFFDKGKSRSIDAFLAKWTKVAAIVFGVVVVFTNIVIFFVK
ncbi:MAG: preprotein translocase subunit SecG [Firmicutes bacterium]|nr:preprotein translocase subunit SecG [Bacillota bacterium]